MATFQLLFYLYSLLIQPLSITLDVCLSSEEKVLYSMINDYRHKKRLAEIPLSASLTKVAQAHVRDLHHHYSTNSSGDCNPHSWSENGNWIPCCYISDHSSNECMWFKPNEIAGYKSNGYEIAYYQSDGAMAYAALQAWKQSKGHNPVIINKNIWKNISWNAIGIGIYEEYAVVWFGELKDETGVGDCR